MSLMDTNCCFIMRLDVGCIVVGVTNFLSWSVVLGAATAQLLLPRGQLAATLGQTSCDVIETGVALVAALSMVVSVLLIVGVRKSKPGLVISYFGFGCFLAIIWTLALLLLLLHHHWQIAVLSLIPLLLHMHSLKVILAMYEILLKNRELEAHAQLVTNEEQPAID